MREGINAGVMTMLVECVAWQHDSMLVTYVDGTQVIMRVVDINEWRKDLEQGQRPLPKNMEA